MANKLSEIDILERLYSPSKHLSMPANKKALVAVAKGMEQAVTHSEMEDLTASAFLELKKLGIQSGDTVVLCSENRIEYCSALLACWAQNVVTTLIDYRTAPEEVFAVCEKLQAKLLIVSTPPGDHSFSIPAELAQKNVLKVINIGNLSNLKSVPKEAHIDYKSFSLDQPLLALFTSGTTGKPKTALHTLRSFLQNLNDLVDAVAVLELDGLTALTPLPVSHIFGLTVMFVTQILGLKTVLTSLDPVTFIKATHYHKPQLIAALPQFYGALLSAPTGIIDLHEAKLLLTGGAPLTVSLSLKFEEVFGKRLNNGYGSTESKIFALNQNGPALSVGTAIGDVKIEIIDNSGSTLPDGRFGEIRITSPTLMEGYLNDETKTDKVIRNNFYYTGDYGLLRDDYLFVAGRKDDVITVAGVVVHAAEVEACLRNNIHVKDVAVTPQTNKRLGQVVKASIVLMDGEQAKGLDSTKPAERHETRLALIRLFKSYCAEHLSRYKRPMTWDFLGPHDDLPKTLAGKINKKALVEKQH